MGVADESSPPVELRISPPVQPAVFARVHVPPLPLTIKRPLAPVVLSTMPLVAPFAEIERKFRLAAPMLVLATLSAMPVVVESVFVAPATLTMPPPVAAKAELAPELTTTPPVKLTVLPVLVARLTPRPLSVIDPLNVAVPPVRLVTSTDLPVEVVVIVPPKVNAPVPPLMSTPRVVAFTTVPPVTVTSLAPRLLSRIPLAAPLVVTLDRLYVPAALSSETAVPVVVMTEASLTLMPVMPPVPTNPADVPVEIAAPCTLALAASVTVPPIVVAPLPIVGRESVPAGGAIPKRPSNGPVAV